MVSSGRLNWLINRLRCMTWAEVAYRSQNSLRLRWLGFRHATPRAAPLPDSMGTGSQWFSGAVRSLDRMGLCEVADHTMEGHFRVLALGLVSLGTVPQWNRDPKTGVVAPLEFGPRMAIGDMARVGDIKYLWEPSRHSLAGAAGTGLSGQWRSTLPRSVGATAGQLDRAVPAPPGPALVQQPGGGHTPDQLVGRLARAGGRCSGERAAAQACRLCCALAGLRLLAHAVRQSQPVGALVGQQPPDG